MQAKTVTKEELRNYHFVHHEVLHKHEDKHERLTHLHEAVRLGNEHKAKVQLICETTDGTILVETTVWALTDSHIELKSGFDIPIRAIKEVVIF
ncbi:MAG: hypothetical protein ABI723_21475 [Bacteroidia bacterium]